MKKVAMVTGGSRGIGLGIVKQLAHDGFSLGIMATQDIENYPDFNQYLQENRIDYVYVKGNLAVGEDRENFLRKVTDNYGRVDLLVNNAGVAPKSRNDILDMPEESFDRLYEINTKGTFFMTQSVARQMVSQEMVEGLRGIIINMSSVSATVSSINRAEYCISKASISMMTTLFADRLAKDAVLVYEIRPGIIKSDMTSKVQEKYDRLFEEGISPISRWGTPEDIGSAVSVLAEGRLRYTTGQVIHVDGGMTIQRL